MGRHLDVVPLLFRRPCPLDASELPRVDGGFGCAKCGHTVVDVATLTLDEVVEQRRRAHAGEDGICHSYLLDDEDRVLLRAAQGSSLVVAVAVSALLAACEMTVEGDPAPGPVPRASVAVPTPALAASREPPAPEVAMPVKAPPQEIPAPAKGDAPDTTKPPDPQCLGPKPSSAKHPGRKFRRTAGI
jgi:hypothetical protein